MSFHKARRHLRTFANSKKKIGLQRFFKTGPGEYAEGDIFIGATVPEVREVARAWAHLSFKDLKALLRSKIHEERLLALIILVDRFRSARKGSLPSHQKEKIQKEIFQFYGAHLRHVNNWDLVDLSAPSVVGGYLSSQSRRDRKWLYTLARSPHLWSRRISVVSTLYFIRKGQFEDTLRISKMLLDAPEDLLHKAVGWMLREVGKKDTSPLLRFLRKHYSQMPRTALRYAIERFPKSRRKRMLQGDFS